MEPMSAHDQVRPLLELHVPRVALYETDAVLESILTGDLPSQNDDLSYGVDSSGASPDCQQCHEPCPGADDDIGRHTASLTACLKACTR
jgi:hypothetical protein